MNKPHDNPYMPPNSTCPEAGAIKGRAMSPHRVVVLAVGFGFVVGAVFSYVQPMVRGAIPYQVFAALFLLVVFSNIAAIMCPRTAGRWFQGARGWQNVREMLWFVKRANSRHNAALSG